MSRSITNSYGWRQQLVSHEIKISQWLRRRRLSVEATPILRHQSYESNSKKLWWFLHANRHRLDVVGVLFFRSRSRWASWASPLPFGVKFFDVSGKIEARVAVTF